MPSLQNISSCTKEKCRFWKKYKEGCPFYLKTTWEPVGGGQSVTLDDCAPKRSMLLSLELYNRMLALQQVSEQERNYQHATMGAILKLVPVFPKQTSIKIDNEDIVDVKAIPQEEIVDEN